MTQAGLDEEWGDDDAGDPGDAGDSDDPGDRPAAEAAAVAGNGGRSADVVDPDDHRFPPVEEHVEIAVTQVNYTIEGYGEDERPIVHVFGRTADAEAVHARVHGFRPYFYVPVDSVSAEELDRYDGITGYDEADADGEPFESIRGERVWKIYGRTPRDVGQVRDEFDHYEADILFPNRFLIDKDVTSGVRLPVRPAGGDGNGDGDGSGDGNGTLRVHHAEVQPADVQAEPRVSIFDIEVDDRSGFPEDGEEEIICIASHDSYRDEYVLWIWWNDVEGHEPPDAIPDYEPIGEDGAADAVRVEVRDSEEAMLADFLDYLDETDPDVMSGWNFDDFDAPYLLDRLEDRDSETDDFDLDPDRLSRVDEVWRNNWGGPNVKGRVVFDLLYAYRRTQFTELESYRLDAVGERELGVGKERYPGDIGDLWEDDPERLLEYNLRDVELCVELDREVDVVDFWDEVRTFVGCKLEDATTPGDAVDMYVLHKLHDEFVLPSKGQQEGEDYEGGAVFDPITGVRENVSVLDLKCFSGDTEVMTPSGPRSITEVDVGDAIYTLDPETFQCEVTTVAETHEYPNRFGELHHLSGNTHDFKVTENHRFLYSNTRKWDEQTPTDFAFDEYRNIPDYERYAFPQHGPISGHSPETFDLVEEVSEGHVVIYSDTDLRSVRSNLPDPIVEHLDLVHGSSAAMNVQKRVGKYLIPVAEYRQYRQAIHEQADAVFLKYDTGHRETPIAFEMANWLEFLGWYVTEGSLDTAAGRLTIHQQDPSNREAICGLLEEMGINYNTDDRGVNVSNRFLLEWLAEHCGEGAAEKRLPQWIYSLDGSLLTVLLDAMIRGDGSRTDSGLGKFWTKSDDLKDGISALAVRCGHKPTVSKQSDGIWYVSIGKRGSFKKATNATVESHDGTVYCLTASDNHVILAGRNGNFQWIGQSLYPMCMVTTNASPETKVDPASYDGETFRAPNGTHFRKEPDGVIREMVDELLSERDEKKGLRDENDPASPEYERYDRQQQAVKVIMNSLYGVLGWDRFRLYDREMGAAVTATGRDVIEYTAGVTDEMGYEVIYGDSVTGDRPVVVRDPEGLVRITPIEDLFECATGEERTEVLLTADGGPVDTVESSKDHRDLEGWEALSLKSGGTAQWQPIEGVIRHRTDKEVVKLQHKFGESTTTRDHSYVVDDGGTLRQRRPGEVDAPLRISGMPPVETLEEIDVYQVLSGYTRSYEDGRSVGSENAEEKVKRVRATDEYVWFGHEHHLDQSKTVRMQRRIELNGEEGRSLIRLLAAYVSEGSASTIETTDTKFGASIAEESQDWLEQLQEDYYRLFENTTAGIVRSDVREARTVEYETNDGAATTTYDDGTWKFQMMNELAAIFFREFAGQTSRGKRIPSFVFHLPDDAQDLFLEVLVEGDGSREFPRYSEEYANRNFDFETTSRELAAGLSILLTQRNRKHSLKYRDSKNSYTIRTCDFYREGRAPVLEEIDHEGYVYDLSVAENDNFVDAVGGIVLHNTDSVMLEIGADVDVESAIDVAFDLEDRINVSYDEFAESELGVDLAAGEEHRFEIEFEKLYRRFFQAGKKKRYAGHVVWKEGKDVDDIDITGFEYQRSDIAQITKRVQKEVIERIVKGASIEEVTDYVHEVIEDYQAGNVSLEDVAIPGGIGKRLDNYDTDTAHVRGAKYANLLLGTNFQRGSKPKRLYLERVHDDYFQRVEAERGLSPAEDPLYAQFKHDVSADDGVICFEYADQVPDEFEVDWEKMLEKTLRGPIARILEALDVSWEEVKSGQEQTGLESFM